MADEEQFRILKQGVAAWNDWRLAAPAAIKINLLGANLSGADLWEATLTRAKLRGADLGRADLWGAHVSETDFNEVTLIETVFANVDLSDCKGLESCIHLGPRYHRHSNFAVVWPSAAHLPARPLRANDNETATPREFTLEDA